jgi:hypothetical protein
MFFSSRKYRYLIGLDAAEISAIPEILQFLFPPPHPFVPLRNFRGL